MKKMYLIVIIILLLFLFAAGVGFYFSNKTNTPIAKVRGVLLEDPYAVNISNDSNNTGNSSDSISIPGFDKLTILSGKKVVGCEIFNPSRNPCYFVAVISLEDGTELYRSGLIAPGKGIYKMTLSQPLSEGTYNATLTYQCYSLDSSRAELNGAITHFILEVIS